MIHVYLEVLHPVTIHQVVFVVLLQVGVVTYSSEAFVDIALGQYTDRDSLKAAMDLLPWRNQLTNTSGALRVARRGVFNGKGYNLLTFSVLYSTCTFVKKF